MKRILLYVHYNKNRDLSEHVIYQLEKIRPLFKKVVFISNSWISEENKKRLAGLSDEYIERENIGFDFAAWRDGIEKIGWRQLDQYDSLTLMNDTCFGPIYPIDKTYEVMESRSVDFWGMTEHDFSEDGMPGTNSYIDTHIQSYHQVFNQRVLRSEEFKKFWSKIKNFTNVTYVIREYETQLTKILEQNGFSWDVFFRTKEYRKENKYYDIKNYAELMPLVILERQVPLLKIKSFLHVLPWIIEQKIKKTHHYPLYLIKNHLTSIGITNMFVLKQQIRHTLGRSPVARILRKLNRL